MKRAASANKLNEEGRDGHGDRAGPKARRQAGAKIPQPGPKTHQPVPDVIGHSSHLLLLFGECFSCLTFVHKVLVDLPEVTLVQVLDYLLLL